MSALEKYGATPDATTLRPATTGASCRESDVIDIATELSRNSTLTSVDLAPATVSVEAAKSLGEALGKNSTSVVQHLSLANCDIHAEAASTLAALLATNDRLQIIELQGNPLRDDGALGWANFIKVNQTLRVLDLSSCKIGPSAARAIGAALSENQKLRSLNLSNNKLRAAGTIALCDGLKRNTSIRTLDLSGNNVNAEGGLSIAELLRANEAIEHLNLARNFLSDSIPQIALAIASRERKLRLLDLSANQVDQDICRSLAQILEGSHIAIACLSLEHNSIGDVGLVAIYHAVKGTAIQFLDLSSTALTSHSGVVIADLITHCRELNSLAVEGNPLDDAAGSEIATAFAASGSLVSLNLERTGIGARTVAALTAAAQKRTGLRNINISENPAVSQDGVEGLLRALSNHQTSLEEVDLSSLNIVETEPLLQCFVNLFAANKNLAAILLEHCKAGAAFPGSIVTPSVIKTLSAAAGLLDKPNSENAVTATHESAAASAAGKPTTGHPNASLSSANEPLSKNALQLKILKNAESIFKPAWALSVPLDPPQYDRDAPEDGFHPPLIPHPTSLHHTLYPGYGTGRFSNATSIQTLSNPVPYNVSISHGPRRPFIPTADGASLVAAPPRTALKESPYSLHALENNPGQLPVTEDQLRRKFAELDVEGNGFLNRSEFKALYRSFQSFGLPMSDKEVDDLFARFSVGEKLSFDEFCVFMLKLAER